MSEPLIHVNGEAKRWHEGQDVAAVLAQREVEARSVATAVNGVFVPVGARAATVLQPGDALTLFVAITGG